MNIATITEQGNGLPQVGSYVQADGTVYIVTAIPLATIHTRQGRANWIEGVVLAECDDDVDDDDIHVCGVEVEPTATELADELDRSGAWDWSDDDDSDRLAIVKRCGSWYVVYRGSEPDTADRYTSKIGALRRMIELQEMINGE
jgi:hypothetical protein